jgi:hypothetical protein
VRFDQVGLGADVEQHELLQLASVAASSKDVRGYGLFGIFFHEAFDSIVVAHQSTRSVLPTALAPAWILHTALSA